LALVFAVALTASVTVAQAVDGTWIGGGATMNWFDTDNWEGGIVAQGVGATAQIASGATATTAGMVIDQNLTLGTWQATYGLHWANVATAPGVVLTWDTGDATEALYKQSTRPHVYRAHDSRDMNLISDLYYDVWTERGMGNPPGEGGSLRGTITGPGKLTLQVYSRNWDGANNTRYEIRGDFPNTYRGGTDLDVRQAVNAWNDGNMLNDWSRAILAKDGALGWGDVTMMNPNVKTRITNDSADPEGDGDDRLNNAANVYLIHGPPVDTKRLALDPSLIEYSFIELDADVHETVGGLYFDGVPQAAGTYGSTSSAATFKSDDWFQGTGILEVVSVTTLTSANSTAWNLGSTWSPTGTPGVANPVIIDGETVTVNAAGSALQVDVTGGSLIVNSALDAGRFLGVGAGAAITVNNGGSLTAGLVENSGGTITLASGGELAAGQVETTGLSVVSGSILTVGEELTVNSAFDVTGVTLNVASANNVLAPGGTLTNSGNLTMGGLIARGGGLNLGGNTLSLTTLDVEADLNMGADSLAVSDTLNAVGGTLTVNNAVTPQVLAYKGGSLAGTQVVPTVGYEVYNATVTDNLAAPVPLVAADGVVELTGNNTYGGKTTISDGAILQVADPDTNIGAGYLEFNGGALSTAGTFARTIGTDPGKVHFAGNPWFQANGAPLTVTLTRGDTAAAPLDWGSATEGFNGKQLWFNASDPATALVDLTNDINLGGNRNIWVTGEHGAMVKLSGNLNGPSNRLAIERPGEARDITVWLAGETVDLGRVFSKHLNVRMVDEATGTMNFDPATTAFEFIYYGVLETSGDLNVTLNRGNPAAGEAKLSWEGGFSAYGGPLTLTFDGGADVDMAATIDGNNLRFGTRFADNVTTWTNNMNGSGTDRRFNFYGNTDTDADYTKFTGDWTARTLWMYGENQGGALEIASGASITTDAGSRIEVNQQMDLRVNGVLSSGDYIRVQNTGSRISGTGTVEAATYVEFRGNSVLAPGGSTGTLTIIASELEMDANAIYEFEFGAPSAAGLQDGNDLVAVSGDLDLQGAWRLILSDIDGHVPNDTDKIPLFTYDGSLISLGAPNIDDSALPLGTGDGEWDITLLQVLDDGSMVYLTGLSGGTPVGPPTIPGDANDNGFVDDDDLAILLSNWEQDAGTITTWELGDFTADSDVDDDDLAVLLGNWTGPAPGGAAVPEPATLALLGLGGLSVLRRRRK